MKRIFIFICLCCLFISDIQASLRQTNYRWRNDDGDETTASWIAGENTAITTPNTTPTLRLRMEFDNANGFGDFSTLDENLQYSDDGGVTWVSISTNATNAFVYTTSAWVNNGLVTTNQIVTPTLGTYVAGRVVNTPSAPQNLQDGERTEYEWVIKPTTNAIPGATYIFQTPDQEDFPLNFPTLTITPICSGTPTAGSINAAATNIDCNATTELSLMGASNAVGISYQWQYLTNGVWSNFGPDNNTVTSTPVVHEAWYRCIVTCDIGSSAITDSVRITTRPLPVYLGNDINPCIDNGKTYILDAGVQQNPGCNYVWNEGTQNQFLPINQSGTYSVIVKDPNGCIGYDTINVAIRHNPRVDLGNDTSICNRAELLLDAGSNGISYFWNTGALTSKITVNAAGEYIAYVTNAEGCLKTDTIVVSMAGELPSIDGISVNNNGQFSFKYSPINPQNVMSYEWDFGDGSPLSTLQNPEHTFADGGSYLVLLTMKSTCGFNTDSTTSHIVGITDLIGNDLDFKLYPNPAQQEIMIHNMGTLVMKSVTLYNVLGQVVTIEKIENTNKHLLHLKGLSNGMYTISITTNKGIMSRKIQIVN
jgi:hypothetical protein